MVLIVTWTSAFGAWVAEIVRRVTAARCLSSPAVGAYTVASSRSMRIVVGIGSMHFTFAVRKSGHRSPVASE